MLTPTLIVSETGLTVLGDQKKTVPIGKPFNIGGFIGGLIMSALEKVELDGKLTATVTPNGDGTATLVENYSVADSLPFLPKSLVSGSNTQTVSAEEAELIELVVPAGSQVDITLSFVKS